MKNTAKKIRTIRHQARLGPLRRLIEASELARQAVQGKYVQFINTVAL